MVSSYEQFSITSSLLTLTKQNPLISTIASSRSVNLDYRRDNLRTAEDNGNLEISGFLTDWIVMKIADFRFVTNTLLTCY